MAEDLKLKSDVAEAFKLVGAKPSTRVSHPTIGVIRLSDVNLEQANQLAADGCKLLEPLKTEKTTGK